MRSFDAMMLKIAMSPQPFNECRAKFKKISELENYEFDTVEDSLANLRLLGVPLIELNKSLIALETTFCPIEKQRFCVVDIETNGSKPQSAQIIEVGAVMVQNGKIIDKFETFVRADNIPDNIIRLTGITLQDTKSAPSLKKVLERFRLFLRDAVFVAHNVDFDYGFISHSMEQAGFGPLLNRKMCSIDLAKKTIKAERYGLSHLTKELGIVMGHRHRAYSDADAANSIFQKSLENLPDFIISTEDLVQFANPNPRKRKKKAKDT